MAVYEYHNDFYCYLASFATRSAERVVPLLAEQLGIRSVVDFGCGHGAWLSVWQKTGADIAGVDGDYVDPSALLIEPSQFHAADLGRPIDLGRQFDLVQSLEVAEHLPAAKAEQFITTLTLHGNVVLFSAASPGQGGEHHVNEQPPEYWRALFRDRGFVAVDYLRPLIRDDETVESWYRFNTILYVDKPHLAALPPLVRACVLPDSITLADYRTLMHRLRQRLLRYLPVAAVTAVSRFRTRFGGRSPTTTSR